MKISREQFFSGAYKIGLNEEKAKAFWNELEGYCDEDSSLSKLIYYFGAMIVISAMTWFMSVGWEVFGGGGIFLIAVLYGAFFAAVGNKLWKKEGFETPGGLLITMAVCMVPLAVYGLEMYFGVFHDGDNHFYTSFYHLIRASWIWMEIATIAAGLFALRYYPFPFLTAPIFFAAWFLSMDLVPFLIGSEASFTQKAWITLIFGVLILIVAYLIDLKKSPQYAFWGYLFGTITFWISLTSLCFDKGEWVLLFYLLVNVSMMIKSVLLKRKVLLVFGAIGAFLYFGHLAYDLFENSVMFPFAMTLLGLLVIYLGVLFQKNSHRIENKILAVLPAWLKKILPENE